MAASRSSEEEEECEEAGHTLSTEKQQKTMNVDVQFIISIVHFVVRLQSLKGAVHI